jgi:hypothetical protein
MLVLVKMNVWLVRVHATAMSVPVAVSAVIYVLRLGHVRIVTDPLATATEGAEATTAAVPRRRVGAGLHGGLRNDCWLRHGPLVGPDGLSVGGATTTRTEDRAETGHERHGVQAVGIGVLHVRPTKPSKTNWKCVKKGTQ